MGFDAVEAREAEPWKHPYTEARTLINDLERDKQIAWIDAPVWPPVGAVIELGPPNRDAVVIGVRLVLPPGDRATILVDVNDPGPETEEFVPRHPADRGFD